jgi:hypothetical protein
MDEATRTRRRDVASVRRVQAAAGYRPTEESSHFFGVDEIDAGTSVTC